MSEKVKRLAYEALFVLPVAVAFVFVEASEGCSWGLHFKFIAAGLPAGLLGRFWYEVTRQPRSTGDGA